jgi:hypothetical protein
VARLTCDAAEPGGAQGDEREACHAPCFNPHTRDAGHARPARH